LLIAVSAQEEPLVKEMNGKSTVKAVTLPSQGKRKSGYCNLASCCSSVVEHFLGKEELVSSILINSSWRGREIS
jgi:hypothetical protein